MSTFRIQARKLFLTYSQADAIDDSDDLFTFLQRLPHVVNTLTAHELHRDGGSHYHCVLAFSKKVDIRNERTFDFRGCHPNVQCVKDLKRCIAYCIKGGNYQNDGFDVDMCISVTTMVDDASKEPCRSDALKMIMRRGGDRALKMFTQVDGYLSVIQRQSALHLPLRVWPDEFATQVYWFEFVQRFKYMIDDPTFDGERTDANKSLWIYGATRLGKTVMARSLGPHWYMNSMWNAECLDDSAKYGVLDDIPWENLKFNYKGMMGMQRDVTVTDKYRKKCVYKGGKPVIVLSNEMPEFTVAESNWISENVVILGITGKCYEDDLAPARVADALLALGNL